MNNKKKIFMSILIINFFSVLFHSSNPNTNINTNVYAEPNIHLLGSNDPKFIADANNDQLGYSVSGVGDVNNDGYADFLIGAPGYGLGPITEKGKTYLIFGRETKLWQAIQYGLNANASFIGVNDDSRSGHAVSGVGDVNADGYDDFVISSPQYTNGTANYVGKSYLFFGNDANAWSKDRSVTTANASFIGASVGDQSGFAVSGVGDVNADGYDDFVIGAPYRAGGIVYLFLGRPSNQWQFNQYVSSANTSFLADVVDDLAGFSVSGVGDVNNDGYDDIMIGSRWNDEGGIDAGKIDVIFGRPSNQWLNKYTLNNISNVSFIGETQGDEFGFSVSGAGDVNNDGYDDMLVGAPYNSYGGTDHGQTYLILGRDDAKWKITPSTTDFTNASFIGEVTFDNSGNSVSGVGDIDNDGYDDFIIGASLSDHGGVGNGAVDNGKSFLFLGANTDLSSKHQWLTLADVSFLGTKDGEMSGYALSGVGDTNGDGFDDLIIGAPFNPVAGTNAGMAYLIINPLTERLVTTTKTITQTVTNTSEKTEGVTITQNQTFLSTITLDKATITETQSSELPILPMFILHGFIALVIIQRYNKKIQKKAFKSN